MISAAQGAPVASLPLDPVTTIYGSVLFPKGGAAAGVGHAAARFHPVQAWPGDPGQGGLLPARADVAPSALLASVVPAKLGLHENIITPQVLASENAASQEIFDQLFR